MKIVQRIESRNNPHVKGWKRLQTKKGRDQNGCFFIEGYHLLEDALNAGMILTEVIVEERTALPHAWHLEDAVVYEVPHHVMKAICETAHPQGIAAVCRKLEATLPESLRGQYLLIDAVQDPGNVGTMIRTADAAGLTGVVLGKGCADPYNGKVLRASQGSLFHLPVIEGDLHQYVAGFRQQQVRVWSTTLAGGVSYQSVTPVDDFALIVGNEGSGIDPILLEQSDQGFYIPIEGQAESLNVSVATGILLYGLKAP